MSSLLTYVFSVNPDQLPYNHPAILSGLGLCVLLFAAALVIGRWRRKKANAIARKLSKGWAPVSVWAGLVALVLVVSRAEAVQFFSMRLWWIVWGLLVALFVILQVIHFRRRHYEVLPKQVFHDPRDAYLPKKKKR